MEQPTYDRCGQGCPSPGGLGSQAPARGISLLGRGAGVNPPNRFLPLTLDPADAHEAADWDAAEDEGREAEGCRDEETPPTDRGLARGGFGHPDTPGRHPPGDHDTSSPTNRPSPADRSRSNERLPSTERPRPAVATRYLVDASRGALVYNDSPDIPFEVSLNPYRGCEHGCSYCYARPYHEYLGYSAGVDFETVIVCKPGLPDLLREELAARSYRPATITISGVTDGYQPIERRLRITRRCLEVLAECRHPVDIVTKSHLVTRDLDLLGELARFGAARVDISLTTLDEALAARMEPRAASPRRRLRAISQCRDAGVPVGVLACPVIPGLTDHELPGILRAAAEAGAGWAHMTPLRLPGSVEPVFLDWLLRTFPDRYDKVVSRQMSLRGGRLNDSRFHHRFRGQGPFYEHLLQVSQLERRRLGLAERGPRLSCEHFLRPAAPTAQLSLW